HGAALIVDEAHALGVLGPEGRGLCAAAGVQPDALVATFGKSFGAGGAFVAGCPSLVTWLWNRARSFVFSTIFIGDTEGDQAAAKACKIPFVHVEYGFGTCVNKDFAVKSFEELTLKLLDSD